MTKLYDMNQHRFAVKQNFKVEFISGNGTVRDTHYVQGVQEVLDTSYRFRFSMLNTKEMFRLFIDKGLSKYSIFLLDSKGDTMTQIKITKEK